MIIYRIERYFDGKENFFLSYVLVKLYEMLFLYDEKGWMLILYSLI